jgi:hypothetical protein
MLYLSHAGSFMQGSRGYCRPMCMLGEMWAANCAPRLRPVQAREPAAPQGHPMQAAWPLLPCLVTAFSHAAHALEAAHVALARQQGQADGDD